MQSDMVFSNTKDKGTIPYWVRMRRVNSPGSTVLLGVLSMLIKAADLGDMILHGQPYIHFSHKILKNSQI